MEKLLGKIDSYRIEAICILLNMTGEALEKDDKNSHFSGQIQDNKVIIARCFIEYIRPLWFYPMAFL